MAVNVSTSKLCSLGILIHYVQDTGDIIIKGWLGCEATRKLQEGILQFPMVLPSCDSCGNVFGWLSLTFLWSSHGLAGLLLQSFTFQQGSLHVTVVGSRHPQEKSNLCPNGRVESRSDIIWLEQYRNYQRALPVFLHRGTKQAQTPEWLCAWHLPSRTLQVEPII